VALDEPERRAPSIVASALTTVSGSSDPMTQSSSEVRQDSLNVSSELPYQLRSGDSFAVRFLHNPELNTEVTVRPDGKVTLPLVGDVPVEGSTIPEVHAAVSGDYKAFIHETSYGDLLKEGDVLDLRFVYNPELNIGVRVRSDGKVSLPLLGDVQAAGLRPDALRRSLIGKYSAHIKNPDVALLVGETTAKKVFADPEFIMVALLRHAAHEIFVGGEVQAPKVVTYEGRITTLQAIMKAGGVKDTGDLSKVVVLRRGQFERPEWIQLNLSKPLSGESIHNDISLKNGDVVIVPMTGIAKVDLFVRQYIREVLPIQSFFNVTVIPLDAGGL
jgi:protein involved in polysaccharide export with SLBB domain